MGVILIVDDEPNLRAMMELVLRRDGHRVLQAGNGQAALAALASEPGIELVVSDLRMEPIDGLGLLREMRKRQTKAFAVMMTAHAEWDTAVRAMQLGAYNFIRKPFDNEVLRQLCRRALAARDRWLAAHEAGEAQAPVHLVGVSSAIQAVQALIEQVSTTDSTVLVTGESGTGKELVARAVHYASLRADGPLVRVNAGALTPSLLESELFGHVRGAFTGAVEDRPGLFALAHGGTLFLDEVGDLAAETQVKLLRVLENGEFLPVGGREVKTCDVRLVAATNRDLREMVAAGAFREDLYYRLAVIPIHLPPLRERPEDIPLLAGHLLSRHAVRLRRGVDGFAPEALQAMLRFSWPGNVRELDNRIQRGVALTSSGPVAKEALFGDLGQSPSSGSHPVVAGLPPTRLLAEGGRVELERAVEDFERQTIEAALKATAGNLTAAAERLGLSFRQIRYKVKQLGIR